jgi:ATP phosphoribosyltransferase regulatory subunit
MVIRCPSFAGDILGLFVGQDTVLTDVAMIQPADPFLDMVGEDLRRRIFLTESQTGENLCLRPEFTIPVCLDHIATSVSTPRRYAYLGKVFRQRRKGSAEFFQAGIEDLGAEDCASADARSVADAHVILSRMLPGCRLDVTLGDQEVFEAVLSALGLPRGWQKRLARAFGASSMIEQVIREFSSPRKLSGPPDAIARLVAAGDEVCLVRHIETAMEADGFSPMAGRLPGEIAQRLLEKAELASVSLPQEALAALREFLAIHVPLEQAETRLFAFARKMGITLDNTLEGFAARAMRIGTYGFPLSAIQYDASFGRSLDYYTGFTFEICPANLQQPLAGGGRYDRLLTLLGAQSPIPGVGFSIWLDRVAALKGDTP